MHAIGPAAANSLFSVSIDKGYLGGHLVYLVLISVVIVSIFIGTQLPNQWRRGASRKRNQFWIKQQSVVCASWATVLCKIGIIDFEQGFRKSNRTEKSANITERFLSTTATECCVDWHNILIFEFFKGKPGLFNHLGCQIEGEHRIIEITAYDILFSLLLPTLQWTTRSREPEARSHHDYDACCGVGCDCAWHPRMSIV